MPFSYQCSDCKCLIALGSYHSVTGQAVGLYCRHCGTYHRLEETIQQYFEAWSAEKNTAKKSYHLIGPKSDRLITLTPGEAAPLISCENCKAEGPFGPSGPITDEDPRGICPRCKQATMKRSGEWIT
ncbi:hypothetical protein LBMAG56_33560 [Verrucomicrobiota bacterium]|nr:hypothetical protein LBMAG56_33560 [Verrucomicrobiota bacterium]